MRSVMAAMADYSPHTDDVALLMIHRKPDEAGGGGPDSLRPADAGTAHERGRSLVRSARCR